MSVVFSTIPDNVISLRELAHCFIKTRTAPASKTGAPEVESGLSLLTQASESSSLWSRAIGTGVDVRTEIGREDGGGVAVSTGLTCWVFAEVEFGFGFRIAADLLGSFELLGSIVGSDPTAGPGLCHLVQMYAAINEDSTPNVTIPATVFLKGSRAMVSYRECERIESV